ncbi:nitroreductase family protein [Bacteroidetes/Chlorobi group bacterium Naka2016]|jgi:nitroreductase|nr:MAG: nitroreductase family protein [Bacteroidetes/Chlorobi group bacterium Naka2016]
MEALEAIFNRKSVRHFTGEDVPMEKIEILLRAGMSAPSAVNMQPWEFVVITNKETLLAMADNLPYAKMLQNAGACIVVCAIPALAHRKLKDYAIIDCSCASQNILIAAEALGLGAVWTALYPNIDRIEFVRKQLGIPRDVIPLNAIAIGIPTGEDQPKDKFKPEKIHFEKW